MARESVYLIRCEGSGAIKIGVSHDPVKRLAQLQTGNPSKLTLVGTIPGNAAKEAEIHKECADRSVNGEWFDLSDEEIGNILREFNEHPNPELDSFKGLQSPELCWMTSKLVGFVVGVYKFGFSANDARLMGWKYQSPHYQVMREDASKGPGYIFWHWHMDNMPQWFKTPEAACAAFVRSWDVWRSQGNPLD